MRLSVKLKFVVVTSATVAAVYLGCLNLSDRLRWQEISDGAAWKETGNGVGAGRVEPESAAAEAGIASGDVLVSINGRPVRDLDDYYQALDLIAPGSEALYLVHKAGAGAPLSHLVAPRMEPVFGATDVYLAAVALVYLAAGAVIFLRNWRGDFSFHFYLVCLLSFILYLFRHTGKASAFDIFVYWLSGSALLLLPAVFFHFCVNFPRRRAAARTFRSLLAAAYGSTAVLLAVHALWFAGYLRLLGMARDPFFRALFDRLHLVYFTAGFAAAAAVLAHSRMHAESAEQRQQLKWIVRIALLALLPFTFFYALPFALGSIPNRVQEMSILGLAGIPLGFAYAIVKYRLMDVDVIFKGGAGYFVASAAVLAGYFALVLFAGRLLLTHLPGAGLPLFALAALAAAFLFRPLHGTVQGSLDRLFYTEQYDYRRSFSDFSKTLSSEISLERLSSLLLQRLQKTMNVDQAALMIRQEGDRYCVCNALKASAGNGAFHFPENIFQDCDRELRPLYLSAGGDPGQEMRRALHALGLYYVQPLRAHDGVIALLALGKRRDGAALSSEDLDLLQAISGYAAIAIENATLYRNVQSKASELEQLKVFSEGIVESIEAGVLTVDPEGRITSLNSGMERLLECSRREHLGKPLDSLLPAGLLEQVRATTGGEWVVSEALHFYKVTVPAGGERARIVNLHFTPFVSRHDIVAGTLVVMDDVTQKVQLEDQLIQAEKLTSLGLLAAGVAHEVNTPLAGISSYTQMLLKELPSGHPQRPILEKMERQTFRASEIVNNLLKFARLGGGEIKQINLNHLVLETLSLLDHQLKRRNIYVSASLDPGLPATYGNSGKLQQVFMNIFLNAQDAMPSGGRLEVRTKARDNGVVVVIRDTGLGIARENIKRIYDPFFTTKEVGRGTGLGLSISYGIIQEHSGNIHVESEPGKGTEFTLQFPVRRVH